MLDDGWSSGIYRQNWTIVISCRTGPASLKTACSRIFFKPVNATLEVQFRFTLMTARFPICLASADPARAGWPRTQYAPPRESTRKTIDSS